MSHTQVHLQAENQSITKKNEIESKKCCLQSLAMSSTEGLPEEASLKSSMPIPGFLEIQNGSGHV